MTVKAGLNGEIEVV